MSTELTSCFGYSVRSEIDVRFTRAGATADEIQVVTMRGDPPTHDEPHMLEWLTRAGVAGKLYGGPRVFDFWADGVGWFRIAPFDRTIEVPETDELVRREANLWGVPSMVTFTRQGDLSVHAAAFEHGGRAVVVGAPGRHGKTTLSLALHAAGCRLLTEDIARVQLHEMPVVLPGPAVLRMRTRDTPQLPPGMRLVAMGNSRAYIEVEPERRGNGEPVPLAAVVLLRVDDSGGIRVERADAATAIRDMWALAFRIPDTEDRARTFAQLADLTSAVPVYNLYRPLTFETLPDVVRRVVELCES